MAALIELSDLADGAVARRSGTASEVGTVYDGTADLIARMTEFVCLAAIGAIGFAAVLVFLWAEALVIGAQRIASLVGAPVRSGRRSAKLKGITQGVCILWLAATEAAPSLLGAAGQWVSPLLIALGVIVTALYGLDYLIAHRTALRASVGSRATARR